MKTPTWKSLGLKDHYETGELIVLVGAQATQVPDDVPITLLAPRSSRAIPVAVKRGPGNKPFVEFYVLEPGQYKISLPWETMAFTVTSRKDLGFQVEFGIFFVVVIVLILMMARRYLRSPRGGHS